MIGTIAIPENYQKLMSIDKVDFELTSQFQNFGTFSLIQSEKGIGFLWIPDPDTVQQAQGLTNIPSYLYFPISLVSQIIRRDFSFQKITLRFVLIDSTRLSRFNFHKLCDVFVTHLISFLFSNGLLSTIPGNNTAFLVKHDSSNFGNDIFSQIPLSALDVDQRSSMVQHTEFLKSINYTILFQPAPFVNQEEFQSKTIEEIKPEIFRRGLDPSIRPFVWVHLFFPEIINGKEAMYNFFSAKISKYRHLLWQWKIHTVGQSHSRSVQDIDHVIVNDVLRNDRDNPVFKGTDNPNLLLLSHILIAYSIYNRDSGYVQGLGDICSPLIVLFIKCWKNTDGTPVVPVTSYNDEQYFSKVSDLEKTIDTTNKRAVFFDDTELTLEEAENFIFWNFTVLIEMTQQSRIFSELFENQKQVLKHSGDIASALHLPLKKLINNIDFFGNSFMFSAILLMYKREFNQSSVFRLWDSIISCENPPVFLRFIAAAIIIYIYPGLLFHGCDSLGDAMSVTHGYLEKTNIQSILQIVYGLWDKINANKDLVPKSVFDDLHEHDEYRDYNPVYFQLNHSF